MNNVTAIGFLGGIIFVVFAIILKNKRLAKRGQSTREYDERQKLMRAKGFTWSFVVFAVLTFTTSLLADNGIVWAEDRFTESIFILIITATVNIVYNIFHDSYYSFRTEKGSYKKMFFFNFICVIPLVVLGIRTMDEGSYFLDGKLRAEGSWIAVVIMFIALLISTNIRFWQNKKAEKEEEIEE